jgi:[ribosomal protein S5]-alanine N-acetyltransferase
MLGPILETERLRPEPPRPDHLGLFIRWFADPDVTRYLLRRHPPSLRQEEAWLERMVRSARDIVWTVVLKQEANDVPIGVHRAAPRELAPSPLALGERSIWGRGYGTEATRACTGYGFGELGLEKILATVYPVNTASLKLLENVGYRQRGLLERHSFFGGVWHDEWLGEILRGAWDSPTGA